MGENIQCSICASTATQSIIDWSNYTINECNHCNLLYCSPMPTEAMLQDYYQGFLYNIPHKRDIAEQTRKRIAELSNLFTISKEKKFLDNGGGTGSAYKAAKELGLTTYYFDLDKEAEAFVVKEHGLTKEFIINEVNSSPVRFDYIFSDNVIEHLLNPIEYVKEMHAVLNEGGEIVIKTPHGKNTEAYFHPVISIRGYLLRAKKYNSITKSLKSYFKRFWHCDPPRHLYSFSEKNLRLIAKKADFNDSEIEILHYNIPLFKYSLLAYFFNFRKNDSLASIIFRIVILPILPFELLSKIVQFILVKLNALSPGGIILKLRKGHD